MKFVLFLNRGLDLWFL